MTYKRLREDECLGRLGEGLGDGDGLGRLGEGLGVGDGL